MASRELSVRTTTANRVGRQPTATHRKGKSAPGGKLRQSLSRIRDTAEATLTRLGHSPDAWREIEAEQYDGTATLAFYQTWARGEWPVEDDPRSPEFATLQLYAVNEQGEAEQRLGARYQDPEGKRIETPSWLAAKAAAIADALLANLDDPEDAFWAGQQMEQYRLRELLRGGWRILDRAASERGRRRQGQSKGGKRQKLCKDIFEHTVTLLRANWELKTRELWEKFPREDDVGCRAIKGADFEMYRTDSANVLGDPPEVLCQVNGPTKDRDITFDTFRGYVTRARNELQKERLRGK